MITELFRGFTVHMSYLHRAKGRNVYSYRRLVPADLRQHYPGREIIKSLKTSDKTVALRECGKVNRQIEAEFSRLRSGLPREQEETQHGRGIALLRRFGIHAQDYGKDERESQGDYIGFAEHLEKTLEDVLGKKDFEDFMWTKSPEHFKRLPEEERAAIEMMRGELRLKASEYPTEYVRLKDKSRDKKFKNDAELSLKFLLQALPDQPPGTYKRHQLNELISFHKSAGLATGSIRKRLALIRAMFNLVSQELELTEDQQHPFNSWNIPGEGEDKKERRDFTFDELQKLRKATPQKVPEVFWLMHLMIDTGLRVNECCGLQAADVYLEDQYPHLQVHRNPFRRLKTKSSRRYVPLVGASLEAAIASKEATKSTWLFYRYIDKENHNTKAVSASNAINKHIKSILGENAPTSHSFRHSMQTRLREVACPEHLRIELGGWSRTVSESYGSTADLVNKTKYLQKAVLTPYRVM